MEVQSIGSGKIRKEKEGSYFLRKSGFSLSIPRTFPGKKVCLI